MRPESDYHEAMPVLNAFLRSIPLLGGMAALIALIAGAGGLLHGRGVAGVLFAAGFFAALYGLWLAWRLHLDRGFFTLLAAGTMSLDAFDRGLGLLLGREGATRPPRTLENRWQGVRALIFRLFYALGCGVVCTGAGLFFCHFSS